MTVDDLLRVADISISLGVLIFVLWRMETGHSQAVEWYRTILERHLDDHENSRSRD